MDYLNKPPWELIKQWAVESGFTDDGYGEPSCYEWDDLRRFAIRVQSAEREHCARLCDALSASTANDEEADYSDGASECARRIREV